MKKKSLSDEYPCKKFRYHHLFRFMKLTTCLLFMFICCIHAENTGPQNLQFTIRKNNVKLAEILDEIEKQSNYLFVYNKHVNVNKKISIDVNELSLKATLDKLFKGSDINYAVEGSYIMLSTGNKSVTEVTTIQQSRTITGIVTDRNTGEPIVGASIVVKEMKSSGTITDVEGKFSLEINGDHIILQISYLGYITREIRTGNISFLQIELSEDTKVLDEVVVVGYGTMKKTSLTGAVTDIKAEDIAATPTSNLSNLLAGRAPGVTIINNSGFVGAGSTIRIRGKGSWNENASALFVIDNIVTDQTGFDNLDPNEVESISFLKDAATTAIYGSRASNGVVLVKTKTGFYNRKPSLTYTGSITTSRPTRELQSYSALDELAWKKDIAETWGNPNPTTQAEWDYFQDKAYDYQLLDYLWKDPWSQQHNLNLAGGSEKISYFASVGLNKSIGSFENTDYDRYNFRSNVSALVNDYVTVNVNISGNQQNADRFYWPYDDWNSTNIPDFYRATFNWSRLYPFYVDAQGNPVKDRNAQGAVPVSPSGWHPIELVMGDSYRRSMWRNMNGIGRVDIKIPGIDGLKTSIQYNYSANDYNTKSFVLHNESYQFQSQPGDNKYLPAPVDPSKKNIHNLSDSYNNIKEWYGIGSSYQFNWFLNYDKTFGNHTISAMGLYEVSEEKYKRLSAQADDLLTPSIDQIFNASKDAGRRSFDGGEEEWARASWVGRLHYEFSSRYIAEFSFRYDGSDAFPASTRWGFFPSGSFAWRISEENFFHVPLISNLKLRGSIGTAGYDGYGDTKIARFQFQDAYSTSGSYIFGDNLYTGIKSGAPANTNITWEKSTTYDIGLDISLFDGKLSGEFDYYYQKRRDILRPRIRVIPTTYGVSNLRDENYAKVDNWGYEGSLIYRDQIGEFTFSIGANLGFADNKIVYIDEAAGLEPWRSAIGQPIDRIWGYKAKGIIRDQKTVDELIAKGFKQFGRDPMLGVLLLEDIRGENRTEGADGKIDDNDKTWLSNHAIPRINYGISLSGQWKGIYIDVLFQGVGGYDKMIATMNTRTEGDYIGGGVFQIDRPYFSLWTDHWSPSNPDAKYPRAGNMWTEADFGGSTSSFWMRSGAYLRMKNINVGYSFPKRLISSLKMENLKIYVNATNLFDISGSWNEMDPEQYLLDSYPVMKTYTAGISVTF